MGWCSATQHVDDVWNAVKEFIPEEKKPAVAAKICISFEDGDWDCQDESEECYWFALQDVDYLRGNLRYFDDFEEWLDSVTWRDDGNGGPSDATVAKWLNLWKAAKGE